MRRFWASSALDVLSSRHVLGILRSNAFFCLGTVLNTFRIFWALASRRDQISGIFRIFSACHVFFLLDGFWCVGVGMYFKRGSRPRIWRRRRLNGQAVQFTLRRNIGPQKRTTNSWHALLHWSPPPKNDARNGQKKTMCVPCEPSTQLGTPCVELCQTVRFLPQKGPKSQVCGGSSGRPEFGPKWAILSNFE